MSNPSTHQQVADFTHSSNFANVLEQAGCSLLVSTYQAGQLCAFGTHEGKLHVELQPYALAMGIAVSPRRVAVGTRGLIWQLEPAGRSIARGLEPAGLYDAALLPRTAHVCGNIQSHEMAYIDSQLWVVNTLFSCLATIEPGYSFVPRWKPHFVSDCYQPGDRCHLNGLAVDGGVPRFVTAMAETDAPNAWRERKHETGVLMDVASNEVVSRGFAMPHSPRVHDGRIWVLDSGRGELVVVDPATGGRETVTAFPGYVRGLSFWGSLAFVGLSRIRETSVFGGLPIAAQKQELKCGIGVVDLRSGRQLASFQFSSGVEEIFAVEVLPGVRCPAIRPPATFGTSEPQEAEIWVAPPPEGNLDRLAPIAGPEPINVVSSG
ncbi:MAG: TIGR03032 family protein [Planctomycetaceae bacterium]|nr:MAG: TIGR03032 family protein [Planctomycetaceae bacterium]